MMSRKEITLLTHHSGSGDLKILHPVLSCFRYGGCPVERNSAHSFPAPFNDLPSTVSFGRESLARRLLGERKRRGNEKAAPEAGLGDVC